MSSTATEPTLSRYEIEDAFFEFCDDSKMLELVIHALEVDAYPSRVSHQWAAFLAETLADKKWREAAGPS